MRIIHDPMALMIAAIALVFAVLFHFIIMRPQKQRSGFSAFCWDVVIFLICWVGIALIYYSAIPLLEASGG
ncbi:hypothetical protein BG621_04530 [Parasaccharibacter apium]|nr:hypothetical protein BG621_04530 [Parasaccharibacter apium]